MISLITGAGTLILGLSWLIGNSLSEVLTSIIFLFIKHPYDVGDRVTVEEEVYTVKEIRLLSTIFLDKNTCSVQAPNMQLNEKVCHVMPSNTCIRNTCVQTSAHEFYIVHP